MCGDVFTACDRCINIPYCNKPFCKSLRNEQYLAQIETAWQLTLDDSDWTVRLLAARNFGQQTPQDIVAESMVRRILNVLCENCVVLEQRLTSPLVDFIDNRFLVHLNWTKIKPQLPWYDVTNKLFAVLQWPHRETLDQRVNALVQDQTLTRIQRLIRVGLVYRGCFYWQTEDNHFRKWLKNQGAEPNPIAGTMNCWDGIIYIAIKAGIFTKTAVADAYQNGAEAGCKQLLQFDTGVDILSTLENSDDWMNTTLPGDVLIADAFGEDLRHVVLYIGYGKFLSLWKHGTGYSLDLTDKQVLLREAVHVRRTRPF